MVVAFRPFAVVPQRLRPQPQRDMARCQSNLSCILLEPDPVATSSGPVQRSEPRGGGGGLVDIITKSSPRGSRGYQARRRGGERCLHPCPRT